MKVAITIESPSPQFAITALRAGLRREDDLGRYPQGPIASSIDAGSKSASGYQNNDRWEMRIDD